MEPLEATHRRTPKANLKNIEATSVVSDDILCIGKLIEQICGLEPSFVWELYCKDRAAPIAEWIPEEKLSEMKVINLRTAEQTESVEAVKLKQFNPSFRDLIHESCEIPCRAAECPNTTRQRKHAKSSEKNKQDLFVCEEHRDILKNAVKRRCIQVHVVVDFDSYKAEDFKGYTYLIGLLEKAFTYLTKRSLIASPLAEVFLNTRNYLVIVYTLLNPNGDNMEIALGPYFDMFKQFLDLVKDHPNLLPAVLKALPDVMNIILNSFRIAYQWVSLIDKQANEGARLGAGLGLLVDYTSAYLLDFSSWRTFVNSAVGFMVGYLVGGSIHSYFSKKHPLDPHHRNPRDYDTEYFIPADHQGNISVVVDPKV